MAYKSARVNYRLVRKIASRAARSAANRSKRAKKSPMLRYALIAAGAFLLWKNKDKLMPKKD